MKKVHLALFIAGFLFSKNQIDIKNSANKMSNVNNKSLITTSSFSEKEASMALKETLEIGIQKGIESLSITDGFFKNSKVRIPFPPEAIGASKKLKKRGFAKEVDQLILSINRAAEDAVASSKSIFLKSLKQMIIKDAIGIVNGNNSAATDFLYKTTNVDLFNAFKPQIIVSLEKVDAIMHWKNIMEIYHDTPIVIKINPDLESHVTDKAINALFHMIAEEEIDIRTNANKRTTDLLNKVFSN